MLSARPASSDDGTPAMPADDRRGDHEDPRPDLGVFGWSVTVLIVVLLVAAVAVAVLVDPLGWFLAVVLAGVFLLWTRLVR